MPTFAEVKAAVQATEGLPEGTRRNLLRAVDIVTQQMGATGLSARVDIPAIQRRFEKVAPATIGYATRGGLSSMMSSFRRALRLASVPVMPGKSRTPLAPDWAALRAGALPTGSWPAFSRFAHWCSEQGIRPGEVCQELVLRHVALVEQTSLKERGDKAERRLTQTWEKARAMVQGWPQQALAVPKRRKAEGALSWSAYPATLEADALAFVAPAETSTDWLSPDARPPLRPATQANYLGALRRAAHELVEAGVPAERLRTLADLVRPERVRLVLERTAARTGRKKGSATGLLAIVLYLVARDHVRLPDAEVALLRQFEKATRAESGMGERTLNRLLAVDGAAFRAALVRLPYRLMRMATRQEAPDTGSARLARAALFLQLLLDTGMRQGNVVRLDLRRHVTINPDGRGWVVVPGEEVKNGEEVRTPLRPDTVRMLRAYVEAFRPLHAGPTGTDLLFARADGSHWPRTQANVTLKELTLAYLGVEVNPHLIRSILGDIIEEAHPGSIGIVKDVLGHRSIRTTEAHYRRRDALRARRLHQAALAEIGGRR